MHVRPVHLSWNAWRDPCDVKPEDSCPESTDFSFQTPSSNDCSASSNVSSLLLQELRLEFCWHGRSAEMQKSTPGVLLVSTSFVCSCRDRFRIPLLHKCQCSMGYHLHCNFLSLMMLLMVETSRQRQESDRSHCGVCRFLVMELWSKHWHLHHVCNVLILALTPGDKWAGY